MNKNSQTDRGPIVAAVITAIATIVAAIAAIVGNRMGVNTGIQTAVSTFAVQTPQVVKETVIVSVETKILATVIVPQTIEVTRVVADSVTNPAIESANTGATYIINETFDSSNYKDNHLTVATIETDTVNDKMTWFLSIWNKSSQDRDIRFDANTIYIVDELGNRYDGRKFSGSGASYSSNKADLVEGTLRAGEKSEVLLDFPAPKDGAKRFTLYGLDKWVSRIHFLPIEVTLN